jgi:fumarate reductase subunit C
MSNSRGFDSPLRDYWLVGVIFFWRFFWREGGPLVVFWFRVKLCFFFFGGEGGNMGLDVGGEVEGEVG